MTNKTVIYLIIFTILALFKANGQQIENGLLIISQQSESNKSVIELSGKWYFHYGDHLSAKEMRELPSEKKLLIKTPGSWTNETINGKKIPAFGIATYYLRIIVNKKEAQANTQYGLKMSSVISAYNIWVNDKIIGQAGNPGLTPSMYKPTYLPQVCYFDSKTDTLDIILHISNFTDPLYGGIWKKIRFGEQKKIATYNWISSTFNIFILSALLLLFTYQISINFIQKAEKSHIYIALLSLFSFIKLLSDGDVSIFNYLPDLDFTIYYRIWLWSFMILPIILRLTKLAYPDDVNRKIEKLFYILYLGLIVYFVFFDIQFVIKNLYIAVSITFFCIAYLFIVLFKAMQKGRKYSVITFIGFTVMIVGILNDVVFLSFQFTSGYLSHIGIFLYITIQSLTVSFKFANSHQKLLEVSQQLSESNKNLAVTVGERTKELNDMNSELANINRQKDFIISTISHDLMGFFNTMLTFTKSLSSDPTIGENQLKTLGKLYQTSNKGYLLLENILTWAKLQIIYNPKTMKIDNLDIIIKENLELFTEIIEIKKIKTSSEIDNNLSFDCNMGNLNTIIRNLISNAVKFCNTNGQVTMKNERKGDKVLISIQDNGIGISNEQLKNIFDPELTKINEGTMGERGSGLGLLIVKELVKTNSGRITCTSELNKGTCFVMEFDLNNKL